MKPYIKLILILYILGSGLQSCKKFLNETPNKNLVIPSSLSDIQALLDYNIEMNQLLQGIGEASTDNYYLTDETWASLNQSYQNMYTWGDEIFFDETNNEYWNLYRPVYNANVALEALNKITRDNDNKNNWDNIKGEALFFRSFYFHVLACNFSKEYDSTTASKDLGIPLRLNSDFNEPSIRSTVEQTYDQIIKDLLQAIPLLPDVPLHVMRPSKPAAYGLLSRVYLSMRNYKQSLLYADSCLQIKSSLLDYNGLDSTDDFPFPAFNQEVIFNADGGLTPLNESRAKIDTLLYRSYDNFDLRKKLYFIRNSDGSYAYRGSYFQADDLFQGIATDEVFLMKAECLAREGKTNEAMNSLNSLMITRYKQGSFIEFNATSSKDALNIILQERRKELLMRDLRWMDLKRLNMDSNHQITLTRKINGEVVELKPNDPRYALPLPKYIIDLTGMPQNPRN